MVLQTHRILRSAARLAKGRHRVVDAAPDLFDPVPLLGAGAKLVRQGEAAGLVDPSALDCVEDALAAAAFAALVPPVDAAAGGVAGAAAASVLEGRLYVPALVRQLEGGSAALARLALEERCYAALGRALRQVLARDLVRPVLADGRGVDPGGRREEALRAGRMARARRVAAAAPSGSLGGDLA